MGGMYMLKEFPSATALLQYLQKQVELGANCGLWLFQAVIEQQKHPKQGYTLTAYFGK